MKPRPRRGGARRAKRAPGRKARPPVTIDLTAEAAPSESPAPAEPKSAPVRGRGGYSDRRGRGDPGCRIRRPARPGRAGAGSGRRRSGGASVRGSARCLSPPVRAAEPPRAEPVNPPPHGGSPSDIAVSAPRRTAEDRLVERRAADRGGRVRRRARHRSRHRLSRERHHPDPCRSGRCRRRPAGRGGRREGRRLRCPAGRGREGHRGAARP